MRLWIILMTVVALLSLPFSGSMAADNMHHTDAEKSVSEHHQHMSASATDDAEHCPDSMPSAEKATDCCDENSETDCGSCPPNCGHCAMSDHGSTAALTMQQTFAQSVVTAPGADKPSFYQLLSGQPSPPPIIS